MFRRLVALTTILYFLFLPGFASSTKIKSAWKDPNATPESFQFKKALVVAIIKDKFIRKVAEDKAVKIIKADGKSDAVASYVVFGETEVKDKEQAKTMIAGQGFDAAIVMKTAGENDAIKYDEEKSSVYYPYNQFWDYYGYGWGAVYNATTPEDLKLLIETRFYSLKDDKLIWAGVSETKDPKNPAKVVAEIAEATTKYLQKQGLIPKKGK